MFKIGGKLESSYGVKRLAWMLGYRERKYNGDNRLWWTTDVEFCLLWLRSSGVEVTRYCGPEVTGFLMRNMGVHGE